MSDSHNKSLFRINLAGIIIFIFGDHFLELLTGIPRIPFEYGFIILFTLFNIVENKGWRKLCCTGPMLVWLILCVYADINGTIQGHLPWTPLEDIDIENADTTFYMFTVGIFHPFVILVSACWCYLYDDRKFLRVILVVFVLYAIVALLFDTSSSSETGRFGSVVGNKGSLRMFCGVFICLLAWIKKHINTVQMLTILFFAVALMLAVQTRKTLIGVFVVIVFAYFSKIKIRKISSWIGIAIGLALLLILVNYMIGNTEVGERFNEIEEQGLEFNESDIPALRFLGDRSIHYYLGWLVWLEHPIFGVGYMNSPYYTNLPFVLHTEYWTQLVENGIIGFTLYLLFLWLLIKPFIKHFFVLDKLHERCVICIGGMLSLMIISITAWTWTEPHFFLMFGVVAAEGIIIAEHTPAKVNLNSAKSKTILPDVA